MFCHKRTMPATRDELRTYCYVDVSGSVPLPKKTKPGEWFVHTSLRLLSHDRVIRGVIPGLTLFEVEQDCVWLRLLKQIGVVDDTVLRLFMAACAEHVIDGYESRYTDGAARRAITSALDFVAGTADTLADTFVVAYKALTRSATGRYEANRAMCAAWMCTWRHGLDAPGCAEEASRAVRADKRIAEQVWQAKQFIKIVKQRAKDKK